MSTIHLNMLWAILPGEGYSRIVRDLICRVDRGRG
jgi:hypothetical protein